MTKLTMRVAARPCASCPYRKDAPSGLWAKQEYDKLPAYDGDIIDQLMNHATAEFGCHQRDGNLCAGWVAAHGPGNLLALRLRAARVPQETWDYTTDVPVFSSGAEAREHGLKDIEQPKARAKRLSAKLVAKGKGQWDE